MSKNGSRGAKFARAFALREVEVLELRPGLHNRKARRLLIKQLRRKAKAEPAK